MPSPDPVFTAAGRLTAARRFHPDQVPAATRALTEARLHRAINDALAVAPPLTDEQRTRLARLLTGGARK